MRTVKALRLSRTDLAVKNLPTPQLFFFFSHFLILSCSLLLEAQSYLLSTGTVPSGYEVIKTSIT